MKFAKPDPYLHIGWFPLPETVHLRVSAAPDFLCGLRALFVTDIHLRRMVSDGRLDELIALMTGLRADIAFLGGDYGEDPSQIRRFFSRLDGRLWPLGCYAVPGNNDREAFPETEPLIKAAADSHIALLVNEARTIAVNGGILQIGGCDEYMHGAPRTRGLFSDSEDGYRILLSHYPVIPDCETELMLSGHTHGGQFNFCGITPYSIGFERRFPFPAVSGFTSNGNISLLISNGIGASRLPLRIGARPQIHVLDFVKEKP